MVKLEMDEVGLLAAIEALKRVSPEQQEAAILELEEKHPGIGQRARALLALEKQTAEAVKKLEKQGREVEEPKVVEPKTVEPKKSGEIIALVDGRQVRFPRRFGAVPALKVVEQPKPEPEPEPEPEKDEPKSEPRKDGDGPVRLNLEAPYDIARTFVRMVRDEKCRRRYVFEGKVGGKSVSEPILRYWKKDFKWWNGQCYEDVDDDQIRAQVYDFLDQSVALSSARIKPKPKNVNEVVDGLKAGTNLVGNAPCWIGVEGRPEAKGLLVCRNGLLELETGRLWDRDPRLFCLNGVDFDFDPRARALRWEQFLREVWPRDDEAVGTLQEFFGLWLTDETKYQKGCGLIGDPRSGKGTIGRVAKGLLGSRSCIGISLQTLGEDFGMANLIGKKLAVVPDVKLDRRMNIMRIMERLLTTMGEDDQTVNRKNKVHWEGKLGIRWLILGNDVPKFRGADEAGGLVARMVMVKTNENFLGREDFDLTEKLLAERAGILNWAMEGWRRLRDRGKFIQPASGTGLVQKLKASTSTIGSFLLECCVLGPEEKVSCDNMWSAFCEWSGRRGLAVTLSTNTFSAALHEVFPSIVTARPRKGNEEERPRFYYGVKLMDRWAYGTFM